MAKCSSNDGDRLMILAPISNNINIDNINIDNIISNIDNSNVVNNIDNSNVVNNNVINNNIVITINNFGQEDRSYIKSETMKECLINGCILQLITDVYFNPDHPENHTIQLKSEKMRRVNVFTMTGWVEQDMNTSIDQMMKNEHCVLTNFFWSSEFNGDPEIDDKTKMKALENLNAFYKTMDPKFFEQRRNIQVMLKNDKLKNSS